jgi:TonB family protein
MFEYSLIDLETKTQPRRRRWISLPIAIALYGVGFTAFAFASYWTVGSVAEPNTVVPFVQLVPSPELPADDVLTAKDADDSTGAPTFSSGTGTGNGNGSEPGVGDGQPIRITVGMTKPEPIHLVQPHYPERLRHATIQGTVVLEAVIDEEGNVTNVRILKGLPMGLDREAVNAAQQWKFKPALLANKPVKVYYTLTVNFMIQR